MDIQQPPARYEGATQLATMSVTSILSNGKVALVFNADGSITCYKLSHVETMALPTDAMIAYLALCEKPPVKWAVHP